MHSTALHFFSTWNIVSEHKQVRMGVRLFEAGILLNRNCFKSTTLLRNRLTQPPYASYKAVQGHMQIVTQLWSWIPNCTGHQSQMQRKKQIWAQYSDQYLAVGIHTAPAGRRGIQKKNLILARQRRHLQLGLTWISSIWPHIQPSELAVHSSM